MNIIRILDIPRMLLLILFLILVTFLDLSDPDYFWHLKTGEMIFLNGALPGHDIFSYTFEGQPWVLHEWLFQLLLYLVHDAFGDAGIKVMTALMVVLFLYIVFLATSQINRNRGLTALLVFVASAPIASFIAPRPQLISYILFSLAILLLIQFKYRQQTRFLLLLPLMMVLWVNMHGGYIIGIALLVLFSGCEFASHWKAGSLNAEARPRLLKLALITLLTVLSSALNPDYFSHWLYPIQVMSMEAARSLITEWSSPDFQTLSAQCYLLLVVCFFFVYFYRRATLDITELVVPVVFIVAGFSAYRHMPFAILSGLPFVVAYLAKGSAVSISGSALGQLYRKHIGGGSQIGSGEYVLNWLLVVIVAAGMWLYAPVVGKSHQQDRDATIPVKATEFVLNTGISGRMFNTYQFGGYLIYRLYPDQKVFIDGRADMYGDKFLIEYMTIYSGGTGWEGDFDKYDIDYVICSRDAPILSKLMRRGDFRLVYDDEYNSVLLKNRPRHAAIIARYGR
ncbi:hypothetical protein Ga0123462_0912 [Mariprofundus ferrinatatus]|uniref:Dolichyl-phosphate-mannose-protein mannosyltransferase n=2 Tax=Mariprofundus ferrinatatus TaxID=1921087 RepID=A0A2K8L7D7_9PROT|nr:hypothetical protein Ga0123462_0912 [Mariprofundus ferrinatatus]